MKRLPIFFAGSLTFGLILSCQAQPPLSGAPQSPGTLQTLNTLPTCRLLTADRIFDGENIVQDAAVLIEGNTVKKIGTATELASSCTNRQDLGDATILPGLIESHAHILFQNVPAEKVLSHGITTAVDTGGPLKPVSGGQGQLRLLTTGPILQAPEAYPLTIFGHAHAPLTTDHAHSPGDKYGQIGFAIQNAAEAEQVVTELIDGGAVAIKIALEPGGETGAPWMQPHGASPVPATPWNMMSQETVTAIVNKAHALGKRVLAHVGENEGLKLALAAKVDELAHIPCAEIDPALLQQAVSQGMTFITTIDTLSACNNDKGMGIRSNTHQLAHLMPQANSGSQFIYGSEIGHDNVPWGINAEELHQILHLTSGESIEQTEVLAVLKSATSEAGKRLGIPGLGTLSAGSPADLIAVKGNALEKFKLLEQPELVISGGRAVVDHFSTSVKADAETHQTTSQHAH